MVAQSAEAVRFRSVPACVARMQPASLAHSSLPAGDAANRPEGQPGRVGCGAGQCGRPAGLPQEGPAAPRQPAPNTLARSPLSRSENLPALTDTARMTDFEGAGPAGLSDCTETCRLPECGSKNDEGCLHLRGQAQIPSGLLTVLRMAR